MRYIETCTTPARKKESMKKILLHNEAMALNLCPQKVCWKFTLLDVFQQSGLELTVKYRIGNHDYCCIFIGNKYTLVMTGDKMFEAQDVILQWYKADMIYSTCVAVTSSYTCDCKSYFSIF